MKERGVFQTLLEGAFLSLLFAVVLVNGVFFLLILTAFVHETLGIQVNWGDWLFTVELSCAALLSCALGVLANMKLLPWYQRRSTLMKLLMLFVLLSLLASIAPTIL